VDLALHSLPRETNEQNVQRVLAYLGQAYWRYLPPAGRTSVAPAVEKTLRAGLDGASSPSLKSAWFGALRDTAVTPETLSWLEQVWRQKAQVAGLTLSEQDYTRLAEELAVRGVPEAQAILDEQYERMKNPDRKAQFAFVRPALSADRAVRDAWFASLADVSNRRHEAWVLEGLRAQASEAYIRRSLEMLLEIQRTGDIFFPKRWMDATLGGHASASAAASVRGFVAGLPAGYPDRLRRIILSSADELYRASRVH
jgi:aminopeptidase N